MKYLEYIGKQNMVPVADAIKLLSPIILHIHQMNLEDKLEKISATKSRYLRSLIIKLVEAGQVDGNLEFYNAENEWIEGIVNECDKFIDGDPCKLKEVVSTVNIKQLAGEIANQLVNTGNVIPLEIKILLGEDGIKPAVKIEQTHELLSESAIVPAGSNTAVELEPASADHRYCFLKTDKGWNLKFNDVVLQGVKDWAGMSYIKILLQNPDQKIGVIKLQELVGTANLEPNDNAEDVPDTCVTMDHYEYGNVPENNVSVGGIDLWESSDQRATQEYKEQIDIIENKLKEARACKVQNKSKIERLEKDKAAFESQLNEASYKGKDPIVDKARRSVLKVITDTIKNIRKLEELCNYNDRPVSSHLTRCIKTGASCSYVTSGDNPPSWQF